jgi:ligand-binding sensor domain-containing protein
MWFGTQDGLNKYDGYDFKVYRHFPDEPASMANSNVRTIYEDRKGVLWVGTWGGGLDRFDREKEIFIHYRNREGDTSSLSNNFILTIYEDSRGILWVGTPNGLNRLDRATGSFVRYQTNPEDPGSLRSNIITTICEDNLGQLWLGTGSGLHRFEGQTGSFNHYPVNPTGLSGQNNDAVSRLRIDHSGTFWVGSGSGLYLFDPGTGKSIGYHADPNNPTSLSSDTITDIYEDHSGILWIATANGLNQFDRRKEQFIHHQSDPIDPGSLNSNLVFSIREDRSGILWIGTAGGGINKFDRSGQRFTTYRYDAGKEGSLTSNNVFAVFEDSSGILWVGMNGGGMDRVQRTGDPMSVTNYRSIEGDPSSLSNNFIFSIYEDRKGTLWVGAINGALHRFHRDTGRFTRYIDPGYDPSNAGIGYIHTILEDRSGRFWYGITGRGLIELNRDSGKITRHLPESGGSPVPGGGGIMEIIEGRSGALWLATTGGLVKFDTGKNTYTRYRSLPDSVPLSPNEMLQAICQDRQGILWLGSFGLGLFRFNPQNETFKRFTEKDGLPNNVVYGILEDDNGCLWLSSNKGISKFDPRTGQFKKYTTRDGLQSLEFNGGADFQSKKGEMFFGGVHGLNAFFPERVRDNPHIPSIVVTNFTISNTPVFVSPGSVLHKHISETSRLTLSYKHNVFSFEFVALDYTIPEKNRYAYKMEGFDRDWNYTPSKKRFATYTNLDPGKYVFRVKGSNNDGVWNDTGTSIEITITPHFTRTWWFQVLAGILIIGLLVFAYKWRTRELAQQTRLKTELQTARDAQMSIMPQSDPQVPGFDISGVCVPASEVGGDFFDYLWLDEEKTKFGIAIGDVSGKAMKAAMTAVMSDGILFSKAAETDSIKEIMTRINRPLYFKTDKRMFTALCLASLDIRTRELIFSNAGLSHPILKSGDKVTFIKGGSTQFPLGVKKDNVYVEKRTQLESGDILLFFTDGIPETQDNNDQFYEYKRIKQLLAQMDTAALSAPQIKDLLIADARSFANHAPQNDDMTVVVVKVN